MTQITCQNVTLTYENTIAVKDVSFTIEKGDYLCIVGKNGSGKSTLLKGILGLKPLHSGQIHYQGSLKELGAGYLPQRSSIQRDFPASVMEVVLSGCINQCHFFPFYTAKQKKCALDHMEQLSILPIKNSSFRDLSGGQQQRVLLARALCAGKNILFLDEPTAGLDPVVSQELYDLVKQLNQNLEITIVMVSHDIPMAVQYASRILHMDQTIQFLGTPQAYVTSAVSKPFLGGDLHD